MKRDSDLSRKPGRRSSRLPGLLLFLAVVLPAAGLAWLGLSAYDAEESRELLRERRTLEAAARTLADTAGDLLHDASLAADSWDFRGPLPSPLLAGVFVLRSDGSIRYPVLQALPAAPPPSAGESERVRGILSAADRSLAESGEPWGAISLLESAGARVRHPDLVARLTLREADLYLRAGREDRARTLLRDLVEVLPAARDEEGKPVAPSARLRLIALERRAGRPAAGDVRALGLALADGAYGLDPSERARLLERLREVAGGRLPPEVERRRTLVDLLHTLVIPDALAHLGTLEAGTWRYLWRDGEVAGYRLLDLPEGRHLLGFRLDRAAFREGLAAAARTLARDSGVFVTAETSPPLAVGSDPGADGPSLAGSLPEPFHSIGVRLRRPRPEGLLLLKGLHVAMVLLLAAALAAGLFLGVRAVRREVAAAKLKQDFTDSVSHELRTPLTSIRMYAEMLDEEELPEEKRRAYLGFLRREAERLSALVSEVLDFARLTRGEGPEARTPVPPAELAARAVEQVRPAVEAGGFSVEVRADPTLPPVRCDPEASARALANLLSNAVAYSGEAREIEVRAEVSGGRVRIGVRDHGPGVPPGERERIFARYHRASRDARRTRGVGLGLALAREIARAQGGDVTLETTGADGSLFVLSLPAAEEEGA